jgi:RNA polymerase sigma factor (sigma-70 family)
LETSLKKAIAEIESAYKHDKKRSKSWINVAAKYLNLYSSNRFENHLTAPDIVMEVINKILNGERNWDHHKVPEFDKFMYSTIQSIVEGKYRYRMHVESVDNFEPSAKNGKVYRGLIPGQYADNHDSAHLIHIKDKLERCYNELKDDDECGLVHMEWLHDKTNVQIAENLGITTAEVEKIKKRIRYQLNKKIN